MRHAATRQSRASTRTPGRVSGKPTARATRSGESRTGDIRSRILKAAMRSFAGKGFDGASLQEIAQAVGIRKASLLYHFSSKEELHRSVLGELLSRWNEALPRLLRAASREDRFDAILEETVAFFLADADRARLLLREVLDRPRHMRRLLVTHASQWMGIVADTIRKAQRVGHIRSDVDPEAYVLQVIHLVVGSVSTWSATGVLLGARADRPPARLVRELIRVARSSLLREGTGEPTPKAQSTTAESEPNATAGPQTAVESQTAAESESSIGAEPAGDASEGTTGDTSTTTDQSSKTGAPDSQETQGEADTSVDSRAATTGPTFPDSTASAPTETDSTHSPESGITKTTAESSS